MSTPGKRLAQLLVALMLMTPVLATAHANPARTVSEFKLANGLVVVVVPDNRAPVVTHMVYYRVGSADEPPGVSGIAHFLEHLMFKSTEKMANGEFSAVVSRARRPAQRVHQHRLHQLLPARRQGPPRPADGDGSRPHGEPAPGRAGGGDRAPGDHRGAPRAHRERALQPARRADVGGAVPEPSLSHPDHRLDARDGEALARGCADLLQALLCTQQRHRGGGRRCRRRRGQGAGRCHLRQARRQPGDRSARCGRRSPSSAPRAAWSCATRAPATPR